MIELLIDWGALKEVKDRDGKTPFELAVESGHTYVLDPLLLGQLLHKAAREGNIRAVQKCLEQGALVNGCDQHGFTALHRAAFKGHAPVLTILLEHGSLVNVCDREGYTALHCASISGHQEAAQVLLSHGANVNARCHKGSTPLHVSSAMNFAAVVHLLLNWGADRSIQALDGRTAYDIAAESRNHDLLALLKPRSSFRQSAAADCKVSSLKGKAILT